MPAERRFDDYGDGGSTFNASCQTGSPLARGQWGCDNKLRVHLVPKPSDHWHKASGADGLPVSSLLTVNPHSGFGNHAINFHGRTPRLRFDRTSSRATTTIHWSEASGDASLDSHTT